MRFTAGDGAAVDISEGFEFALLESLVVKEAAFQAATAIAARARATAPVLSGSYRASIGVEAFKTGARVVSNDPVAHILEFGAPHRGLPARDIFHNAALALGFTFRGHG